MEHLLRMYPVLNLIPYRQAVVYIVEYDYLFIYQLTSLKINQRNNRCCMLFPPFCEAKKNPLDTEDPNDKRYESFISYDYFDM